MHKTRELEDTPSGPRHDRARSRISWRSSKSAAEQALSRLKSDRHYKPGRTELTDLTGAHQVDANFGNLWSVLNDVNNQVPGTTVRTRTVLILPDEAMYGVGRMYQSLAENSDGIEVEIHRSADAALAALGLDFCTIDELYERGHFLPHTPV
jgi:hypothetical protein